MKRLTVLYLLLFVFASLHGQDKILTREGVLMFEASVPSFEEVKAKNENVTCVLNIRTGELTVLTLMSGFKFKIALMEEHFNDNYIESHRYPKTTFRGKIKDFNINEVTENGKFYDVKGKLELHGKTRVTTIRIFIRKANDSFELISDFELLADDFNIEIPSIVSNKVSKKVKVNAFFNLK